MPVVCTPWITSPHLLVLLMLPVLGFFLFFFARMERGMSAASREAEKGLIANWRNRCRVYWNGTERNGVHQTIIQVKTESERNSPQFSVPSDILIC